MHISLRPEIERALESLPPLLTRAQCADAARVCLRTVGRWIAEDRLRATSTHPHERRGRTLILKSSLLDLLAGDA